MAHTKLKNITYIKELICNKNGQMKNFLILYLLMSIC
jgi:hypothetical protein